MSTLWTPNDDAHMAHLNFALNLMILILRNFLEFEFDGVTPVLLSSVVIVDVVAEEVVVVVAVDEGGGVEPPLLAVHFRRGRMFFSFLRLFRVGLCWIDCRKMNCKQ